MYTSGMSYLGSDKQKATRKLWRERNRESVRASALKDAKNNAERIAKYQKNYSEKNRKRLAKYYKDWRAANLDSVREYMRNKRKTNIQFRIGEVLRTRQTKALAGNYKRGSFVRDLGCTISELKFYLEGKFAEGMNWENYGHRSWHIDHVIPLAFFDLTDREQFLKACHYTNLQPMWAKENLKKGHKVKVI